MIGIATTFFWIFLIGFFISAVYSVKDVQFNLGGPQFGINAYDEAFFSLPVSIVNRGLYDLSAFKIFTQISDNANIPIVNGTTKVPLIKRNDGVNVIHNMSVNIDDLLNADQNYLFNDSDLRIYAVLGMTIAKMIPVEASSNLSVRWGAPLYNFALGQVQYSAYNSTHLIATIPISFENHAFFDVAGNVRVRMYNSTNRRVGSGEINILVPPGSSYNGSLQFYATIARLTATGRFDVYFSTQFFDYGPVVIHYG
jgi:hypothetical protein